MDRYLRPGTTVRLVNQLDESWDDGVVVHCWLDDAVGVHDCYVAFFGAAIPEGKPADKPCILRYASTSPTVLKS